MTRVSPRGSDGTRRRASTVPPEVVYTLCLVVLILASLILLGIEGTPGLLRVLALVIGAGSAGILLGHFITLRRIEGKRVEGIAAQQLPHEHDQ